MSQRPTYLVAVSGGNICMGYSPTNLTPCTNGTAALHATTTAMSMVDGPGSPNDGGEAKFHRQMFFADGFVYKRLDAHTGVVTDWEAFNGTDAASGETVYGLMPFSADFEANIAGLHDTSHPSVAGDVTDVLAEGDEIAIQGTEFDGFFEIDSLSYNAGTERTEITLTEDPGLDTTEGTIARVTGRGTILARWRNRCVMAGLGGEWFMSAAGDFRNWDYSPATPSATMAVAGNLGDTGPEAGNLGDDITGLVPMNDDLLLIAGTGSLGVMRGDPADGGILDTIHHEVGMVGPDAWAFDSDGNLYIFATDGLHKITPAGHYGGKVSAGIFDKTFAAIDYTENRAILQWDKNRSYVYIFIVKDTAAEENERSYIFDTRTGAFWPIQLPDENGPTATTYFEAPAANDRGVLLGGRDGYVRGLRDGRPNDRDTAEDVAIDSMLQFGPVNIGDGQNIIATETYLTLGLGSGPVELRIYSGSTPEEAAKSTTIRISTTLSTTASRYNQRRVGGQSLVFQVRQNLLNVTWYYEGGKVFWIPGGKTRRVK